MYTAHFGLREPPFTLTPNPAYVYFSHHHQEALAHLLYGTGENGGFVQLTGEVGTGKTTLVRTLLEQPQLTVKDLLATVCDELGAIRPGAAAQPDTFEDALQFLSSALPVSKPASTTLKPWLDALNAHLLQTHAAGRRTVLIIDEAQLLSREVLEQVRLLTNLETTRHKLLRIILVGQPELREMLARPDLRQLAQRITARYHLLPLNRRETAAYIGHRLQVAGGRPDLFTHRARRAVYRHSSGIPRLINVICDRALLGAYTQGAKRITPRHVQRAAQEALPGSVRQSARRRWLAFGVGLAGLAMLSISLEPRYAEPLIAYAQSVAASLTAVGRSVIEPSGKP